MPVLPGLMMEAPLVTITLLQYAARYHPTTEIVSRSVEGPIHRYDYARCYARTQQLAHALSALGIAEGDRVATIAWNGYRHLELYYAIPGVGAVCHTINPRLHGDQIIYIVNHAQDRLLFVDLTFVPLIERIAPQLTSVEAFVIMTDRAHMPKTSLRNALSYEELIASKPETFDWPEIDERAAGALCYTSGTTSNPKGVLYSQRSLMIYAMNICMRRSFGYAATDSVLPVVPMFHVHAWGIPFGCPLGGAKLVLPGAKLDPESLYELFESEEVTVTAGVPTIWAALIDYLRRNDKRLTTMRLLAIGGAAAPRAMVDAFEREFGVPIVHGWGMTETTGSATDTSLAPLEANLPYEQCLNFKTKQGRGRCFIDIKVIDEEGRDLPCDGKSSGELCVRGPWIASAYYKDEAASKAAIDAKGWLHTGDVATIDPRGYVQIVDRRKDMIKSGGEWISSIDLENLACAFPGVAEAAVIAKPDPRWGERPLLVVRPGEGKNLAAPDILAFLATKVAKLAVPDEVVFLQEIPHTATGKIAKRLLRQQLLENPRRAAG